MEVVCRDGSLLPVRIDSTFAVNYLYNMGLFSKLAMLCERLEWQEKTKRSLTIDCCSISKFPPQLTLIQIQTGSPYLSVFCHLETLERIWTKKDSSFLFENRHPMNHTLIV